MTRPSDYLDRTASFLRASERRHLPEAEAFLAPDVRFVFPGATFERLADVHAAASTLYRSIRKTFMTWDVTPKADGSVVVVGTGTLSGINVHGVAFEGIRYADRFTWRDDRIVLHEVWNDLAVSGVLARTS